MSKALKLHFANSGQVTSPQVSSTSLPADSQQVRTSKSGASYVNLFEMGRR